MTRKIVYASFLILLLLSVILGFIDYSSYYRTERDINVVDLATFGLTLFLAWYVPNIIEKKASGTRFEKEMLIRHIERLRDSFAYIQNIVNQSTLPLVMTSEQALQINSLLADISRSLNQFQKLIDVCNYRSLAEDKELLVRKRIGYKQKVTGDRFQEPDFGYNSVQAAAIAGVYSEIEMACSLTIIKINRL